MTCEEAREAFEIRLDGPAPGVDLHLESCYECRRRWLAFEAGHRAFREAFRLPAPPPDLSARVLARLHPRPSPWLLPLQWLRGGLVLGTVAAWLLLAASLVWLAAGPKAPSSGTLSPAIARAWQQRPDPPRLQLTGREMERGFQ